MLSELGVLAYFGPKKSTQQKSAILRNILNLPNFLCHHVSKFPLYILLKRRINTIWYKGIDIIWSGDIETFWHRKSQTKNWQYSQKFFELYQLFMNTVLCQAVLKSSFCILAKLLTTWLTNLCYYPTQLFYFRLSLCYWQ